ncbi:hypothetical protein [Ramlibacter alkalitolerans]|uniref:DUF4426 domain-containing protein n=1 Tax=Ramlibacter alkalitolerans TaxID=2039631 RepID=A0ABS1JKV8_9BURK|nr:hypothetical protein [Ramlibacter alkalitolerans]MBL0424848.1 hypothetical protein [Ramlibacter alkalitolerans]
MQGTWYRRKVHPVLRAAGCAALLACAPAAAGEAQAILQVSITVTEYVHVRPLSALPPLEVAASAIRQGYVDAPLPLKLEIITNSASSMAGQQLQVHVASPAVRSVTLLGSRGAAAEQATFIAATPGRGMRRVEVQLWLRLHLSDAAVPGTYGWPMEVSMTPL